MSGRVEEMASACEAQASSYEHAARLCRTPDIPRSETMQQWADHAAERHEKSAALLRGAARALREMSEALKPFADAFEKQTAGPKVSEPRRNWNARMPGQWEIELKVKIEDGRRAVSALAERGEG